MLVAGSSSNMDRQKMATPKKTQPITENTTLPTPLTELEDKLYNRSSAKIGLPNSGFFDQERKQIALEESEARYRRLFETAKDGILILDGETGRITDVNPFLQDMLGYSITELIGKELWEIGPVKDIAASQEAMRYLQNSEYIRYEDLPLETKAGERKQVEFVSNVYLVNGWKVIQCNIRDITARKRAEAGMQTANVELLALVDELQWRDRAMQLHNHMNDLLQSCVTQAEAYQVITLAAGNLFPGYNGCLAILHAPSQHLEVVARWGIEVFMQSAFSLEDCWALRRGQLHEVVNPQVDLLCHHFIHSPKAGYLCLPLMVQGETLGVLCLSDNAIRKGKHQIGLQQLAVTVGETIKLSLSNLKLRDELRQQAIHDPLTSLFNRRYLDETLSRELDMAQRRNAPLCVVMLDIDGFKQFNDSFGHGPGDALLREFAGVLRERLRKSDISCRYGGDEFVLVLPDSSIADTQERVEQIRKILKLLEIHYGDRVLGLITLSAGIAQTPEHGTTASELLRAADEAMYAAKQAGRDRIVIYQTKPLL
jgi:diguanylate cyclase (GGDEF)-like protein/PAS domain S-box-containing protein